MKKSIAFYCCTNGLGHYKRVYEVAKNLKKIYDVTIYCNRAQAIKIGFLDEVNYKFYEVDNIRWDLVTSGNVKEAIDTYFLWNDRYGVSTLKYDLVVSDNLPILLSNRKDLILMGSFLWKDVFHSYLGPNRLSKADSDYLDQFLPPLLTNKYVETQSVKTYENKVQFGFGCDNHIAIINDINRTVLQYPSLPYLSGYTKFLDELSNYSELGCSKDLSYIDNTRIVARPGVGTITHCVEHRIPLIALYSEDDSKEIVELADRVEKLKIGYKQNINEPLNLTNIKAQFSNSNYFLAEQFEKQGYLNISKYIKDKL